MGRAWQGVMAINVGRSGGLVKPAQPAHLARRMYSTCLFCHADLGRNEIVEPFPMGRRLAFDAATGRLWVVCRRCERWNLTPMEERWEAIEACERLYRDTRTRVATDQIGLARVTDPHGPVDLVRVGRPLRPEMAAWRYGDQFGRRHRRAMVVGGLSAAAAGAALLVSVPVGIAVGIAALAGRELQGIAAATPMLRVRRGDGRILLVNSTNRMSVRLIHPSTGRWGLVVPFAGYERTDIPKWRQPAYWNNGAYEGEATLIDEEAARAARQFMPLVNGLGATRTGVRDAVGLLESAGGAEEFFAHSARRVRALASNQTFGDSGALPFLPQAVRLAMEMAANEETERRALEGELALLEAAWRDADEIAQIADNLTVAPSIRDRLSALRSRRTD